ncbi:MAG: TRASH domain-containing protein [Candidatus Aenigmatarchaeota archaeon]
MPLKCLICRQNHKSSKNQDPLSCGVCRMCGMTLCGKRLTMKSAGKVYAFCSETCKETYKRMALVMRKKLLKGEITEEDFSKFENGVVI